MKRSISTEDEEFCRQFENCQISAGDFNHRAHLRVAFAYLCESDPDSAHDKMKAGLLRFLEYYGVDSTKYHETMTYAWLLAVRHFMELAPSTESFCQFISENPRLQHFPIMLTHYSHERLFSDEARHSFLQPDKQPIPTYAA